MDKKTLRQYRDMADEVMWLWEEITRLRAKAESYSQPDGTPRSKYRTDRLSGVIAAIADLCDLLDRKRSIIVFLQAEIESAIAELDPKERQVIRTRYIEGLNWAEICEKENYSWRQVHYIHSEALKKLERTGNNKTSEQ